MKYARGHRPEYVVIELPSELDLQRAFDQAEERIIGELTRGVHRQPLVRFPEPLVKGLDEK